MINKEFFVYSGNRSFGYELENLIDSISLYDDRVMSIYIKTSSSKILGHSCVFIYEPIIITSGGRSIVIYSKEYDGKGAKNIGDGLDDKMNELGIIAYYAYITLYESMSEWCENHKDVKKDWRTNHYTSRSYRELDNDVIIFPVRRDYESI